MPGEVNSKAIADDGGGGNSSLNLVNLFPKIGNYKRVGRNVELFESNACGENFFLVLGGAVRIVSFFEDGRRQIGAFHLPGEIFGFDVSGGSFSAEAVVDTEFMFVRRIHVMELAHTNLSLINDLLARTIDALHQTQERMLLLGRQTAEERLENFLIDMAHRIGDRKSVELPMDRRDIADYLALAIETVSRTFAELERKKHIESETSRRIRLTGVLETPSCSRTYLHANLSKATGTGAAFPDAKGYGSGGMERISPLIALVK